jgi:hypothetical protein
MDDHRARVSVEAILETRGILGRLLRVPLHFQLDREGKKMLDDLKHYVEHRRPSPRKQRRLGKFARLRDVIAARARHWRRVQEWTGYDVADTVTALERDGLVVAADPVRLPD